MGKKALKVLGITALLGLIAFLAYKSLKKCDTQTPNEENPITSSGSLGTGQYVNSGSLGTNPYGFKPSQFENFPTGLLYAYIENTVLTSSGSIGTWRYIYKSAIGTSQYNNRWW